MATTTNYGWTTPDDTDLVKNGADAIRTLGSAIDTTAFSTFIGQKLISTTSLTGASVTLSSIPQTYRDLKLVIRNYVPATDNTPGVLRFNGDTNTRYRALSFSVAPVATQAYSESSIRCMAQNDNTVTGSFNVTWIFDYTDTTIRKTTMSVMHAVDAATTTTFFYDNRLGFYNQLDAITSITLLPSSGNFTGGTALLYGVQ